jgi:hypothetical protein
VLRIALDAYPTKISEALRLFIPGFSIFPEEVRIVLDLPQRYFERGLRIAVLVYHTESLSARATHFVLLVPQSFDWIHFCSPHGWINTKHESYSERDKESARNALRYNGRLDCPNDVR